MLNICEISSSLCLSGKEEVNGLYQIYVGCSSSVRKLGTKDSLLIVFLETRNFSFVRNFKSVSFLYFVTKC